MIEVMIAVLVLGLVAVASLKLVSLSERGLSQVRMKEALLDEANRYMIELAIDPTNTYGKSGDVSWSVEERSENLLLDGLNLQGLDLEGLKLFGENSISADIQKLKEREQKWRELEVTKNGQSITLFLPYSELADSSSGDLLRSGDRQ
ncbi:MAG: hypothetical protein LBT08_06365 [Synergistaceae bacterium]|nr:hypothetical protein [Synergistaceae bacterium]